MPGANLIFHLVSAVILIGMMLYIVQLQKQVKALKRDFLASKNTFVIDWPLAYLSGFCKIWGIHVEAISTKRLGRPVKIYPAELVSLMRRYGIDGMVYHSDKQTLDIYTRKPSESPVELGAELSRSLNISINIKTYEG